MAKSLLPQVLPPELRSRPHKFSAEIKALLEYSQGKTMTIGEIASFLRTRGFAAVIFILCLPFIIPLPLPGLSLIFGIIIIFLGFKIATGHSGELPGFLSKRKIDPKVLDSIGTRCLKFLYKFEKLFKPRLKSLYGRSARRLSGISILLSGVALALPLPPIVPFSNTIPALAVTCVCIGLIEEDGLFTMIGMILGILTWVYFAFWGDLILSGILIMLDCRGEGFIEMLRCSFYSW